MKKSLPCDLQKTENGIGRRPESNTACIPMQLNNGVCPIYYKIDFLVDKKSGS